MSTGFAVGCFIILMIGLGLLYYYARSREE
jgi:hypothetical protein